MMRFLLSIIICALLAFVLESFFAWWIVAMAAFIVAFFIRQSLGKSFMAGFLAIFSLWLTIALIADAANDHILAGRMAQLFHLPNAIVFMIVAAVIGGVVGGMAAWSGAALRKLIVGKD